MSVAAMAFMSLSWIFVLGLTFWSFRRVLKSDRLKSGG